MKLVNGEQKYIRVQISKGDYSEFKKDDEDVKRISFKIFDCADPIAVENLIKEAIENAPEEEKETA